MEPSSFQPFSLLHGIVVLAVAACIALLVIIGFRWRGTPRQRRLEILIALAAILVWLAANGHSVIAADRLADRIPFHVTDILGIVAPAAMLWPAARAPRALLYYWGIGLASFAFITPDLHDGPARPGFWLFFGGHLAITACAVYDLLVRGYRPDWGDFRIVVVLGLAYAACAVPLNLLLDANYGFLGTRSPGQRTLIDLLPPWPWRVGVLVLLGIAAMAVMTWPWSLKRFRSAG